jgi:hypothetical protein
MGCHSWFYVHFPEKKEEMEHHFRDDVKRNYQKQYEHWLNCDPNDFGGYLKSDKKSLEYYHNHTIEEIIQQYPNYDSQTLRDNKFLSDLEWDKKYDEMKQFFIDESKQLLDKCDSLSLEELFKHHPLLDCLYFLSFDGKLYIEADSRNGFGIETMHDMFRIHNYEAEPCNSVEEVLQRCKENDVELTEEQLKELNDWFSKYPDTIITFG